MQKVASNVIGAIAAVILLLSAVPAFAATPGSLVKLASDHAVYYVGNDNNRYAFPNLKTYLTWYKDFSGVQVLSPAEMAALPLAGNIVYRPGTRLVKVTTDPRVYAVEPGGTLRAITSEAVASALYGPSWNRQIDDLPDAFFVNYVSGAALDTATFPNGSVVRRSSDDALFLIDGGLKRHIVSTAVLSALHIQDTFIRTASDSLGGYTNGADVTGEETLLTDTAQKLTPSDALPTFSFLATASTFPAPGDATLGTIRLTSGKSAVLSKLTIRLKAMKDEPLANGVADLDDDAGGLVRGLNEQANILDIRIVDAAGNTVMPAQQIRNDFTMDQTQAFTFTGSISVPAGGGITLRIKAHVDKGMPLNEPYAVTIVRDDNVLDNAADTIVTTVNGAALPYLPVGDVEGPTVTSVLGTLTVTSAGTPAGVTVVKGSSNVEITGHTFTASAGSPNIITRIAYVGFIDEREPGGATGFAIGQEADNFTPTAVNQVVPMVSLYDNAGTRIAGPVSVDLRGNVVFDRLQIVIPANGAITLVVRGDINGNVDIESANDAIMFDIEDAYKDVTVTDDTGAPLQAVGEWPNGGPTPKTFLLIAPIGIMDMSWVGGSGEAIASGETLLGQFSAAPRIDDYEIQVLNLKNTEAARAPVGDLRAEFVTKAGVRTSVTARLLGDTVTFPGLAAYVPHDTTTSIAIFGKVLARDAGVVSGERISLRLDEHGPFQFRSLSTGKVYNATDLGNGTFTLSSDFSTAFIVRWSMISVEKSVISVPGSSYREADTPVLRFTMKASPQGGIRVNKLTFRLTPSDHGFSKIVGFQNPVTVTSNNDSLERWANMNGDFADDDAVANLYQVTGTTKTLLGEGSNASLQFTMSGNPKSEGVDSTPSDYGLLTYTFPDGGGIGIGPGGALDFLLALDTTAFDDSTNYALTTELLGDSNFIWSDSYAGGGASFPGTEDIGVPLQNSIAVLR